MSVGVTGLALLALMGDGNTRSVGPRKMNVDRGLSWLQKQQDPDTGVIGSTAATDFIYGHAIATLALAEACVLGGKTDPAWAAAQRAIDYLERHRNPYSVWRYQPRDNDNDTSVTAWCVDAMITARDAGLEVKNNGLQTAKVWIDSMTDPTTGRTGYNTRGGRSARNAGNHAVDFPAGSVETITAMGVYLRRRLGVPASDASLQQSAALLRERPPVWDETTGSVDSLYWHFASHALFQLDDRSWEDWSAKLHTQLIAAQVRKGAQHGSWEPVGVWSQYGGRTYSTALNAMALQSGYRVVRSVEGNTSTDDAPSERRHR